MKEYERKVFCYQKSNDFFYLDNDKQLPTDEVKSVKLILEAYKIPEYLTNVLIVVQTLTNAHHGLVFKGQDSKNRWQYFYGKEHVIHRKDSKLEIILKVKKVWFLLQEEISVLLSKDVGSFDLQIGLIMYFLSNTYIRTGKHVHYKFSKTRGLITLSSDNIILKTGNSGNSGNSSNSVRIKFIGKDNVNHDINLNLTKGIYNKLLLQKEFSNKFNFPFFFCYRQSNHANIYPTYIKEKDIYSFLEPYNINPKDIRTYGSNINFLSYYLDMLKPYIKEDADRLTKSEYKKIISKAIEMSSVKIGHTKSVSKNSYISSQLLEIITSIYEKIFVSKDIVLRKKILNTNTADLLELLLLS